MSGSCEQCQHEKICDFAFVLLYVLLMHHAYGCVFSSLVGSARDVCSAGPLPQQLVVAPGIFSQLWHIDALPWYYDDEGCSTIAWWPWWGKSSRDQGGFRCKGELY